MKKRRVAFLLFTFALFFITAGSVHADDTWTESVNWDTGRTTNYVLSYSWSALERHIRERYSIIIKIEGSDWTYRTDDYYNARFVNMLRSNLRGASNQNSGVAAMAVWLNDNDVVSEIQVFHVARQNDGTIGFWETFWMFD